MIDPNVNTEGHFEFRVKPKIEHMPQFLNRAIEELQQIILTNKDSSKAFMEEFAELKAENTKLQEEVKALQGAKKE